MDIALLDEWAPADDPNETLFRLGASVLDAMAADENGEVRVTSVVAPAGSGKTMLMAQRYAELTRAGRPVAWVSIGALTWGWRGGIEWASRAHPDIEVVTDIRRMSAAESPTATRSTSTILASGVRRRQAKTLSAPPA